MTDRLEQIRKDFERDPIGGVLHPDVEWLLDEVDRLRRSNEGRLRLYRSMKSKRDRWAKQASDLRAEVDRLRAQRDKYGMAAFGCWVCAGEGSPDCTCEPEDPQTLDDLMGDDAPRIRALRDARQQLDKALHALVVAYPVAASIDRQVHAVVDAQRTINGIHEEAP